MKIAILTFHCALNYGAIMQTYGLQEYLKKIGHEVYVIDYRPEYLLKPYRIFNWRWSLTLSVKRNIFLFIRTILVSLIRLKRKKSFSQFTKKYINLCSLDFSNPESEFDAFIFGSDQIWNPLITNGFDNVYFGQFPAVKGKRLVVYAASAGNVEYIKSNKKDFISLLSSYTEISVREKSLADFICKQQEGKQVEVVVDPVLLVGKSIYERIASKEKMQKNYVLVFLLSNDMIFKNRKIAEFIAKAKGLEIVELVSASESLKTSRLIDTASPERFISLFRDASYVVTSSYHGTIFSILFEKDFTVVDSSASERMVNLLIALDLKERLAKNEEDVIFGKIDYRQTNEHIKKMRLASQNFLEQALA